MEADAFDGGDSPAVSPSSPQANWVPRNPDGSQAVTRIEQFSCHHRWAACSWEGRDWRAGLVSNACMCCCSWLPHQGLRQYLTLSEARSPVAVQSRCTPAPTPPTTHTHTSNKTALAPRSSPSAHSYRSGFWARMPFMQLVGTCWADNPETLQLASLGGHVSAPHAGSWLDDTL